MAKRERLGLTAVRTEGAILPVSILQRIHLEDRTLDGLKPEQYDLTGDRLREAASRAWTALQGPWLNFKAERSKLASSEAGTSATRNRWLYPVLRELHFGPLEPLRESLKYAEKEFSISHRFGHAPIHLIGCGLELDKRTPGAVGAAKMSPHGLLQSCLNSTKENLWGFVSNGLLWRVLRDDNSLSRQSMVEFDLEAIFEGQLYDEFLLFFLVCHRSRIQSDQPEQCWLEKWSQAAGEDGKRALNTLRDGVQKSIEALGQGFLKHPANHELRSRIRNGELDKQDYYRQLLRMVYRLLFLFVAEDRGLLLDPKAKDSAKALFNEHFSTRRLRLLAERMRGSSRHHDLFAPLKLILAKLGQPNGCAELALPALGGFLFSESTAPDLDGSEIANVDLLESIRHLAVTREGERLARVDYKNLGTEEFGSVYESLLELHPDLASDGTRFELISASGNERKTTGSYYTPDPLIQCLLDTALDPVVAEAVGNAGPDPEARAKAILALSVIDPAVGSGHFLIAAAHRLAKRLAQIRTGDEEPSPDATRHAIRDVIGKCLYGIDLNPMAAELCKVSLWIEALEPGKPLSFLDHHIVVGNSLLGTTPELIAQGIPESAFDSIEGDDKDRCKALKKRNKEERGPQGSLFAQEAFSGKNLLDAWRALDALPDETLSDIQAKENAFQKAGAAVAMRKLLADAWCAAFVMPKLPPAPDGTGGLAVTTNVLRLISNGAALPEGLENAIQASTEEFKLLHPHLVFPEVFAGGGFDVVLGNPPWEKIKISEIEFFSERAPEIARQDKAGRNRMIRELKARHDPLYQDFLNEKRRAAVESAFLRRTGGYPLTARGDMNLYALFAERICGLIGPSGRAGFIVPTELATNYGTSFFFSMLVDERRLASIFDFENGWREEVVDEEIDDEDVAPNRRRTVSANERLLFPSVDSRYRISLYTVAGKALLDPPRMASMLHRVEDLGRDRVYVLHAEDIRLMNPNTGSAPMMHSARHADIVRRVYQQCPVLVNLSSDKNPWRCRLITQFHMSNDREDHFVTSSERDEHQAPQTLRPLYEAKMMHQFDHRWGTYAGGINGKVRDVVEDEKKNPDIEVTPRYWVDESESERRHDPSLRWVIGWRDITNPTNARTTVASALPRVAFGNKVPLLLMPEVPPVIRLGWLACANSFAMDFVSRQKIAGVTYNFYLMEQMPFPTPKMFLAPCPWAPDLQWIQWVAPRVAELSYSAHDMEEFARDLGVSGPPVSWDSERRLTLRAELDAAMFRLYGLDATDAAFVLDTFPLVKRREISELRVFRTRESILKVLAAFEKAEAESCPYVTALEPAPARGWIPTDQAMPPMLTDTQPEQKSKKLGRNLFEEDGR